MFAGGRALFFLVFSTHTPFSETVTIGVAGILFALCDVSLWFLLAWLLDVTRNPRLMRAIRVLAIIDMVQSGLDAIDLRGLAWPNPVPAQIVDGLFTVILAGVEFVPIWLIAYAVLRRHRLDPARWTVAILAFVTQMLNAGTITLAQGSRFTHLTLAARLGAPLFTVYGSPVNAAALSGFLLLLSLVWAVWRYSVESRRNQIRLEEEIRNARAVQQVLVPDEIPAVPGFTVESVYKPAGEVGGDFFQILPLNDGGVLAVIGDVSGKGIPAAMTVSLLVGTLRTLAHYTQSPAEILTAMNHRMIGRSQGGFTTCLIVRADRGGSVTIANAGHLAPYRNGQELGLENGLPLGLNEDAVYVETTLQLGAGDQLTLLTDGVVEARAANGELFGFERTTALAKDSANSIAQAAQHFGQEDDITVLTLRLEAAPAAESVLASAPALSPTPA